MAVNIQPLADYVVAVGEEAETKTASGIYLPGNAQESLLYRAASHLTHPHMPPQQPKLGDAELSVLAGWINRCNR